MSKHDDKVWKKVNKLSSQGRLIPNGGHKAKDFGGWKNHKYIDKYRSKRTGKWVYVYELKDGSGDYRESGSRNGMTKEERRNDDRQHRAYNRKRAGVHTKGIFSNLGKATKAIISGKNAGKYADRARTHALKLLRNVHNIAVSRLGNTGKTTKVKSWLEKKMYSQFVPLKTYIKSSKQYKDAYYKHNKKYLDY